MRLFALADQHDQVLRLRIGATVAAGKFRAVVLGNLTPPPPPPQVASTGISSSHQRMTRSDFEKKPMGRQYPCGCPCSEPSARYRRSPGWPQAG